MRQPRLPRRRRDDLAIGGGLGRRRIVEAVGDAEAAAGIDMVDLMAVGAEIADEIGQEPVGLVERAQGR